LEGWVDAGLDPSAFWGLTLREIAIILKGATKRLERERNLAEMTAWLSANLGMIGYHDPKKFPEFSKVSSAERRRQPWEEIKAAFQSMTGFDE